MTFARLAVLAVAVGYCLATATCSAEDKVPDGKERQVLRPVLWWSDLKRVSDGGGGVIPSSTTFITELKGFAKEWNRLGLKGTPPKINFKDYVVVVAFRVSGIEFESSGGLELDAKGNAKVVGPDAFMIVTNAGWYSTTVGVFPRDRIATIDGKKLPAIE